MARYDRDFLVPYLENLCALHIVQRRLEQESASAAFDNNSLKRRLDRIKEPRMREKKSIGLGIFLLIVGILSIALGFLDIPLVSFCFSIWGWIFTIGTIVYLIYAMAVNHDIQESYDVQYEAYEAEVKRVRAEFLKSNRALFNTLAVNKKRMAEVTTVLNKVYSANVIPMRYRDIYAITYLYEWFGTSAADDLDMALNTYVLEEIKDRLDVVINQNAQSLLNQRLIIANQYRLEEQQRAYHQEMVDKLDRLNATAEEQARYLRMIEGNTAANSYFSAANYVSKL